MQKNKNTTTLEKFVHTEISTCMKLCKCYILHTFPLYIPVNMIPCPAGRAPFPTLSPHTNDFVNDYKYAPAVAYYPMANHAAKQTKGNKHYLG